MNKKIIQEIEKKRRIENLSKLALCSSSKLSVQHYSNILSGKADPSLSVIERLCNAVGLTILVVSKDLLP